MSRRSLGGMILPGARACRAPADLPTIVGLPRGGGGARLVPEALDLIILSLTADPTLSETLVYPH